MKRTKAEKAKVRRKDYVMKKTRKNMLPSNERKYKILSEGDGVLPKSRKYTAPKFKK